MSPALGLAKLVISELEARPDADVVETGVSPGRVGVRQMREIAFDAVCRRYLVSGLQADMVERARAQGFLVVRGLAEVAVMNSPAEEAAGINPVVRLQQILP